MVIGCRDSKINLTNSNKILIKQLTYDINNIFKTLNNSTWNETAQCIRANDHLHNKKGKKNTTTYGIKSIVNIELGIKGNELSFRHPCLIMFDKGNRLFVVPCTSGQAPKNEKNEILWGHKEVNIEDGFAHLSTLLLNEACFVDKTRVISKLGKANDTCYKQIYEDLFELLFETKSYNTKRLEKIIKKLEEEKDTLQKQIKFDKQSSLEEVASATEKK